MSAKKPKAALLAMVGQTFGKRVVTGVVQVDNAWLAQVRCECGDEGTTRGAALLRGKKQSCQSCRSQNKATTHGMSRSKASERYKNMIARCYYPKATGFKDYGGRGITVADEFRFGDGKRSGFMCWHDYVVSALGEQPSLAHQIDRIDNNRGYERGNVRWATRKEQQRNRRANVTIQIDGEAKCIAEVAEQTGIDFKTVAGRVKAGWSAADIISRPATKSRPQVKHTKRNVLIEIEGETMTLTRAAREYGISRARLDARIKRGMSAFAAVTLPPFRYTHTGADDNDA